MLGADVAQPILFVLATHGRCQVGVVLRESGGGATLPISNFWLTKDRSVTHNYRKVTSCTSMTSPIHTSAQLGAIVRSQRQRLALRQLDVAGLGNTGNRFIVELENGKPTLQLQKVLDVMDLLGLELIVQPKASRMR
jgi:HTH-type transcriptional regulator / antitoxin HipB